MIKTSNIVFAQLPDFVRDDHPKFVQFIEAYYRFLETYKQPNKLRDQLKNTSWPEQDFNILSQIFLADIPAKDYDPQKLIPEIRHFYASRGSALSIDLLMNLLGDASVSLLQINRLEMFANPTFYIKLNSLPDNTITGIDGLVGNVVQGQTSSATGKVIAYTDHGDYITLQLENVIGNFQIGEMLLNRNFIFYGYQILPQLVSVSITNAGEFYCSNDNVRFTSGSSSFIHEPTIRVGLTGLNSSLNNLDVFDSGVCSSSVISHFYVDSATGVTGVISGNTAGLWQKIVSNPDITYDGHSELALGLRSSLDPVVYEDVLKKLVVPVGTLILPIRTGYKSEVRVQFSDSASTYDSRLVLIASGWDVDNSGFVISSVDDFYSSKPSELAIFFDYLAYDEIDANAYPYLDLVSYGNMDLTSSSSGSSSRYLSEYPIYAYNVVTSSSSTSLWRGLTIEHSHDKFLIASESLPSVIGATSSFVYSSSNPILRGLSSSSTWLERRIVGAS